jgi:hypothetical protein
MPVLILMTSPRPLLRCRTQLDDGRDNNGPEADLLLKQGNQLPMVETKSGQTTCLLWAVRSIRGVAGVLQRDQPSRHQRAHHLNAFFHRVRLADGGYQQFARGAQVGGG